MRCVICDSNNWTNIDEFRLKPSGMAICNVCSMVSYPSKWKTEEEIKEHYRKDYRPCPTSSNLFTGQRKLHFHNAFLSPLFEEWKSKGLKEPEVYEIGAAYGMALAWLKDSYPGAKVGGTELTISYRRNAYYEYGIELSEDFDDTKQYDLIMSYKVAEHQLDIDKMLTKYRSCLKDDGYMYISVPIWFGQLNNFGMPGFDLEYYYDPNHINVWSRKLFESLLKKVGFEIVRVDHIIYDSTYLVKKCELKALTKDDFEDYNDILNKLKTIKLAYIAFTENRFNDAILLYKDYPQAHISYFEMERKNAAKRGWSYVLENHINKMLKDCSTCAEIYVSACDISMRFKQFEEAIKYAELSLKYKPGSPVSLSQLINIMREIAINSEDLNKRYHYFSQARQISKHLKESSLQNMKEAVDYIYLFNSKLPLPSELKHNNNNGG